MPLRAHDDDDPWYCVNNKKMHICNDYVCIYYNDR